VDQLIFLVIICKIIGMRLVLSTIILFDSLCWEVWWLHAGGSS